MPQLIQSGSGPSLQVVVCLCAEWCDTCRSYKNSFTKLARDNPADAFVWIDIEDDSEWVADIDVENFPTLLIAFDDELRFFGTLLPQPGQLARLLQTTRLAAAVQSPDAEILRLLSHIRRVLLQAECGPAGR